MKELGKQLLKIHSLRFENSLPISTTAAVQKTVAAKWNNRTLRFVREQEQILTYDMHRRPHHLGASKAWMAWNTQNLEGFRQQQGVTIAQDEVIRRFVRAIFFNHLPLIRVGTELVIKRRGNVVYVAGFLKPNDLTKIEQVYWMWGFTEEILSNLLKQPVKLELQFVRENEDLAYAHWIPKQNKS